MESFKDSIIGDSSLKAAVSDANTLLKDTKDEIGTGDKQYKQEKADAVKAAIEKANAVLGSSDSSQEDINKARQELDEAVTNFKAGDDFKFYPLAALAGLSAAALLFINKKRKLLGRLK